MFYRRIIVCAALLFAERGFAQSTCYVETRYCGTQSGLGVIDASKCSGGDACVKIRNAIASLPCPGYSNGRLVAPGGGVVDARAFTGPQACNVNPVGEPPPANGTAAIAGARFEKPFQLLLGAAIYHTVQPWSYGMNTLYVGTDANNGEWATNGGGGQYIVGAGQDVTILQPTATIGGPVIQISPRSANNAGVATADVVVGHASMSELTIDLQQAPNRTAIQILSGKNLAPFRNLSIYNAQSTMVRLGTAAVPGAANGVGAMTEGVTFDGWYFYGSPVIAGSPLSCGYRKAVGAIVLENTNETVFRDGKLIGSPAKAYPSCTMYGVELTTPVNPSFVNTKGEGNQFVNASIGDFDKGVYIHEFGSNGAPRANLFSGLTMEANTVGFSFSKTDSNTITGTRFVWPYPRQIELLGAGANMIIQGDATGGAGAIVFDGYSYGNTLVRSFVQADQSDVADYGYGNVIIGGGGYGKGLQLGSRNLPTTVTPGIDASSPAIKHARLAVSVGAGADVPVTITWATSFPDANYTPVCTMGDGPAGDSRGLMVHHISDRSPDHLTVVIHNGDATATHADQLSCIAVHD